MQKLNNLQNKKICLLGFGIENQALLKFLIAKKINFDITVCDAKKDTECPIGHSVSWRVGKNYDKNLDQFDIIFRSPGYPLFTKQIKKAKKAGVIISSPMKLFFDLCPSKTIIGVTGTKGKGTTASLIYQILKAGKKRVWLGGNIGIAPFTFINKIKKNDWVVLELSSFQLEDIKVSPKISIITNFTKEHLAPADPNNPNYHKTMLTYKNAKTHIIKWQKKNDQAIINQKLNNISWKLGKSKKIFFTKSYLPSLLAGEHNKENIAAAIEVAKIININKNIIQKTIANFKGLEHRIELAGKKQGRTYYNDSFATTPESAIIALKSFTSPITLLVGGADKGSNFKSLAKEIKRKVQFVVLLKGQATPRIKKELLKIKYPKNKIKLVHNIKTAVQTAQKNSQAGDIILLSPACASFGMFNNYKERGKLFKKEVKKI